MPLSNKQPEAEVLLLTVGSFGVLRHKYRLSKQPVVPASHQRSRLSSSILFHQAVGNYLCHNVSFFFFLNGNHLKLCFSMGNSSYTFYLGVEGYIWHRKTSYSFTVHEPKNLDKHQTANPHVIFLLYTVNKMDNHTYYLWGHT